MPFGLGLTFKRLGEFITTVCSVQVLWSDELFMTKILFIFFQVRKRQIDLMRAVSLTLTSPLHLDQIVNYIHLLVYMYICTYIYCCQIVFSNWCRSGGNLIRKLRLLVAPSELLFAVESKNQLPEGRFFLLKGQSNKILNQFCS